MASIDLPRALQDYFAFAETTPTRNGRRFSITLPYVRPDGRLDRLQWWYHMSPAKEMALGDGAQDALRAEAVERFTIHIERWLHNTRQELYGDGTIPNVAAEGNRVMAAYRVDPAASEGLAEEMVQSSEDGSVDAAVVDDPPAGMDLGDAGGGTPTESDHRPASKTAFG